MALEVLETIATPHQRESIERDVLSGFLTSNVLAAALAAIDWPLLTVEQLATIFGFDKSRDSYGSGPIAVAVKYDLLPKATAMSAELLLRAVLAASPRPAPPGSRFSRYSETDLPTGAWLLDVLPNCLERLLQLLPSNVSTYPDACMEAAERLEAQRECGFTDRDEFIRIRDLLSAHPRLRWPVALEIARSDISNAAYRLVWGSDCIVVLARTDLDELIARANDADKMIGSLWFDLGVEVAFRYLEKAALTDTLATLAVGSDMTARKALIATRRREEAARKWKHRGWNKKETERKKIDFDRDSVNTDILRAGIGQIRDESGKPALNWLVNFSREHRGDSSLTNINYEVIARTFGQEVSEALAEGLKAVWASVQCLDPADYAGGAVPWEALTAMAGLNTLLGEGSNVESLNELDAGRAARLAIWELNGPPSWFEPLVRAHRSAVVDALRPWIERDAQTSEESSSMRRSIEMAFRCSPDIGAMLLAPILQLIADGRIENQETLRRVATTLRTGEQISSDTFIDLCQSELLVSLSPDGIVGEIHWLYAWLSEDAFSAWHWFERHVDSFPGKRAANTP